MKSRGPVYNRRASIVTKEDDRVILEEYTNTRKHGQYFSTVWKTDDDLIHRDYGPAIIWKNGAEFWYVMGELHRLDGPAITWEDGDTAWFINGHDVTTVIQEWSHKMNIDLNNLSEDDKLIIAMKWHDYYG